MQNWLVLIIFLGAVTWLGRVLWAQFAPAKAGACKSGCGCETSKLVAQAQAAKKRRVS